MNYRSRGFTLLEMLMAMVIMTFAIVATLGVMAAGTKANAATGKMEQAISLASNVHEYAMTQTIGNMHNNLDTSSQFVTCIDAQGNSLTGSAFSGWTESRTVTSFAISDPTTVVADSATNCKLLAVEIRYNNVKVYSTSWVFTPTN